MSSSGAERPPRVGVTTYREPARWGVWDEPADLLPVSYAAAVADAGGLAVLLPPSLAGYAAAALDGVHGLLLAGGPDVEPARYGAPADPQTGAPRRDRDEWELALAREALARDLPLLAVCRGMQVLNVALGGDLVQHLPDAVGNTLHCPIVGRHGHHDIAVAAGSRLEQVLGARTTVATYHHQAVARLGDGLTATGWADDGVVEAVELAGHGWVFGVQWHPEAHDGKALFDAFVAACAADRDRTTRTR